MPKNVLGDDGKSRDEDEVNFELLRDLKKGDRSEEGQDAYEGREDLVNPASGRSSRSRLRSPERRMSR